MSNSNDRGYTDEEVVFEQAMEDALEARWTEFVKTGAYSGPLSDFLFLPGDLHPMISFIPASQEVMMERYHGHFWRELFNCMAREGHNHEGAPTLERIGLQNNLTQGNKLILPCDDYTLEMTVPNDLGPLTASIARKDSGRKIITPTEFVTIEAMWDAAAKELGVTTYKGE